jgi:hypothetical protein
MLPYAADGAARIPSDSGGNRSLSFPLCASRSAYNLRALFSGQEIRLTSTTSSIKRMLRSSMITSTLVCLEWYNARQRSSKRIVQLHDVRKRTDFIRLGEQAGRLAKLACLRGSNGAGQTSSTRW